ncbi:hypothetical protein B0G57_10222 [Trinickia symbiotica]|uniref:Permease n=1 Tax=Trinickia symbiotica TaxID=863227 RepID=A0A2N7X9L9_9BURK|nr:hypothetical protein [Trinickia symbiotica]PMS38418.1 permease [Trinickia symbiotica]PPK46427.1 hypothetical protein B0G57_10222 [Trinickia symbiotica]
MNPSNWTRAYLRNAAMFLPAIVFLLYARLGPGEGGARWDTAYVIGGALAIGHAIWLLRGQVKHGIALGVDLYLVVGGVLSLISSDASRTWGEELGAASVLICVLVVGIAGMIVAPQQFFGDVQVDPAKARTMCMVMIVITAAALALAVLMRHSAVIGGVLPIVALVIARGMLKKRVLDTAAN